MDISSGKYVVGVIFLVILYFFIREIYRDRRLFGLFKRQKTLRDYSKTEITTLTESLIIDLCNMYGTNVPKWGYNNLRKDKYMGVYIGQLKTIYFDYDYLYEEQTYLADWFVLVVHEFTHYFDHITLENEGKDWDKMYLSRKDFYESRADDNSLKVGEKLYLNYLRDGNI